MIRFSGKNPLWMLVVTIAVLCYVKSSVQAQTLSKSGYDKVAITPSQVFTKVDLLNRLVDVLIDHKKIKNFSSINCNEKNLGPFHVYQLGLACNDRLFQFAVNSGVRPIPQVVSKPIKYLPEDVMMLAELMIGDLYRLGEKLKTKPMPLNEKVYSGKTPTDVFKLELQVFAKLVSLTYGRQISPSEAYAQVVRCVSDARYVLETIDPESRFRIDTPKSARGLKPKDVFGQCRKVRREINKVRDYFNLATTPIPDDIETDDIKPNNVYVEVQLIIAEMNLLKMGTKTMQSTPLPISVSNKTPSDVHEQASILGYLVSQIIGMQEEYIGSISQN